MRLPLLFWHSPAPLTHPHFRVCRCRPNNVEDYIHRIGRTGRAGAKGVSISFFTEKASKMARELVTILREVRALSAPYICSHGESRLDPHTSLTLI